MVRSIGEESSSGKDILDTQKVKIRHQKWDRRISDSKIFMKIPLTGPEKSICSRWEKQYSVSEVEASPGGWEDIKFFHLLIKVSLG